MDVDMERWKEGVMLDVCNEGEVTKWVGKKQKDDLP